MEKEVGLRLNAVFLLCWTITLPLYRTNDAWCNKSLSNIHNTGSLVVTNLRILWISHANSKINLSVGLSTIMSANIKQAKSKLRGHTQVLTFCNYTTDLFLATGHHSTLTLPRSSFHLLLLTSPLLLLRPYVYLQGLQLGLNLSSPALYGTHLVSSIPSSLFYGKGVIAWNL